MNSNKPLNGRKLNDILNPEKLLNENAPDENIHALISEMKQVLDNNLENLYLEDSSMNYSTVVKEQVEKSKRRFNMLYGGWALWAFGGEYMDKVKEWWKR